MAFFDGILPDFGALDLPEFMLPVQRLFLNTFLPEYETEPYRE